MLVMTKQNIKNMLLRDIMFFEYLKPDSIMISM